jgi:hypothetical protein
MLTLARKWNAFETFGLRPYLPSGWNFLELKNIHAFNSVFDIRLKREQDKIKLVVVKNGTQAPIQIN